MDRYRNHWLKLAKEARESAGRLGDRVGRQRLLAMAQKYETLARGYGGEPADHVTEHQATA
ncbi:MAG TPA: hypothetical protein VGL83_04700 [Stellaceae bacterium]|jgi:hypothetical protein